MNWLDLFGEDYRAIDRYREAERRYGPCEDSQEVTAPYIGICPDDSYEEEPSPLDFGKNENGPRDRSPHISEMSDFSYPWK